MLRNHLRLKEIHTLIILLEHLPLLLLHHRRQLHQVAYKKHLHPPKRLVIAAYEL